MALVCLLTCPRKSHDPIVVPDRVCVTYGRREMMVNDNCVLVFHFTLFVDYDSGEISVRSETTTLMSINGDILAEGHSISTKFTADIDLVYGIPGKSYKKRVCFCNTETLKRTAEIPIEQILAPPTSLPRPGGLPPLTSFIPHNPKRVCMREVPTKVKRQTKRDPHFLPPINHRRR